MFNKTASTQILICATLASCAPSAFANFYTTDDCIIVTKTEVVGEFSDAELREKRDAQGNSIRLFAVKKNETTKLEPKDGPDIVERRLKHQTKSATEKVSLQITALGEPYAFGEAKKAVSLTIKKLDKKIFPDTMPEKVTTYLVGPNEKIDNLDKQRDEFVGNKVTAKVSVSENILYTEVLKAHTVRSGGFDNETYKDVNAGVELHAARTFDVKIQNKSFDGMETVGEQKLTAEDLARLAGAKECLRK